VAGRKGAVANGKELETSVSALAISLGLDCKPQVKAGKRIWGAERRIDIVLTDPVTRKKLGVECKFQGVAGSVEEKIPATLRDIEYWPISGIVVIAGPGFSQNMVGYLLSTGRVVWRDDFEDWLKLFFSLA
jgi:hypothetical protein